MKENNSNFNKKGDTIYLVNSAEALEFLNNSVDSGFISSLHIIGTKCLFDSLVECCKVNKLGFDITADSEIDEHTFLYGKAKYLSLVCVDQDQEGDFVDYMYNNNVELTLLGHVTKGELRMDDKSFGFIDDYIK